MPSWADASEPQIASNAPPVPKRSATAFRQLTPRSVLRRTHAAAPQQCIGARTVAAPVITRQARQWREHLSTGIDDAGRQWVEGYSAQQYQAEMQGVETRLQHYLREGEMLKTS